MKIDIKDLLASVQALRSPGCRIGIPDDPTLVYIADPQRFSTQLENALCAFRDVRGGKDYLVSAEVNTFHRAIWVRFVQRGPCHNRNGQVEPALEPSFQAFRAEVERSQGELHYWGGNNYFDISLRFRGRVREPFPEVNHLPWDKRYRYLLRRASWGSLRSMIYRFSNSAEAFAVRCAECEVSRILIPSVGLCVHPWLFADRGMSVVATEGAESALAALSEPDRWPRLYSRTAFEQWDIAESASYATQGNPDSFTRMPDLEDRGVRESLRERITFALSDWAELPLQDASVDAIFATNALPRASPAERLQVLKEWVRVVRPGGRVLILQHNFFGSDIDSVLRDAGWVEANVLGGEHQAKVDTTGFRIRYSSG